MSPADDLLRDLDLLAPLDGNDTRRLLMSEVEQLRACEIRVGWRRDDGWLDDERARLTQFLDDGAYVVVLNPAVPDVEQMQVLERVWSVWLQPNDETWLVESAKPDDPGSLPIRTTTFLTSTT